ncbi:hypothetical protein OQA88_5984 [Cercophora sp. LCS_1]
MTLNNAVADPTAADIQKQEHGDPKDEMETLRQLVEAITGSPYRKTTAVSLASQTECSWPHGRIYGMLSIPGLPDLDIKVDYSKPLHDAVITIVGHPKPVVARKFATATGGQVRWHLNGEAYVSGVVDGQMMSLSTEPWCHHQMQATMNSLELTQFV